MLVRGPSGTLDSTTPPDFRCSAKSPEAGLVPRFSLRSLSCQSRVSLVRNNKYIYMPVNNLDLPIRRFSAPDRERSPNV